ncbi:MAG: HEAT repeat domain-containing protein [Gemmatimonadaceae bacterium]|nr:HEAT repeat domain-containing protein [Gemmatimonadaceae bacterium]
MLSLPLLHVVLILQGVAIVLLLASLLIRSSYHWWYERRHGGMVHAAASSIARMLGAEELSREAERRLAALPRPLQIRVMWEIAPNLSGESLGLLAELARRVGLPAWAESICSSSRWHRRLVGLRILTLLGINSRCAIELLDDPHPLVRAQAIEGASDHADEATVASMIEYFADPSTLCLFTTQNSLCRIGEPAVRPLVEYLEGPGRRALEPALEVAIGLAEPRLLPAALVLSSHAHPQVRSRATALLGAIGGERPVSRLIELRLDVAGDVRAAAARALGVLGHWQASPAVAMLLRDPEFQVRREAGLALLSFGGPGQLMLRRYRTDADDFAADMARQVLGLPGVAGRDPA